MKNINTPKDLNRSRSWRKLKLVKLRNTRNKVDDGEILYDSSNEIEIDENSTIVGNSNPANTNATNINSGEDKMGSQSFPSDSSDQQGDTFRTEANDDGFITSTELINKELDEIPMLLGQIFPKVGIAAVFGSSDVGKSSFLRQFAFEVACGNETFLDYNINATHHRAIYVSTEDDEDATSFLLRKQYGNPNNPDKTNRLKYIFQTENLLKKLEKEMSKNPVDLVVVDAFTDLYSG